MTAENAARGRSNRRKGAEAERAVVAYLRANGFPDARRYLAGDSRQPGDIDWHPLICLETKNVKGSSCWPTWCRQAVAACRPGLVPAVVRRTDTYTNVGAWECRYRVHEWVNFCGGGRHWFPRNYLDIDGWRWAQVPFEDLVAAVRQIDRPEAAA